MGSSDKGYIKLYRDIRDNWVWEDKPFARGQAWADLIMMMNHKDREVFHDGRMITVKRGSRITSLRKLAERWGWSRHKVSEFLDDLEKSGMISQKRDSKKTLINVIKYDFFQGQQNQKGTVKGHSSDTEGTQKGHSSDTEGHKQYIKKNEKECIKNDKEEAPSAFSENDDTDDEEGWGYD